MSRKYNWAILGCGKIAQKFSSDLKLLSNARLYAAASRDLQKAQKFAADLGFESVWQLQRDGFRSGCGYSLCCHSPFPSF